MLLEVTTRDKFVLVLSGFRQNLFVQAFHQLHQLLTLKFFNISLNHCQKLPKVV